MNQRLGTTRAPALTRTGSVSTRFGAAWHLLPRKFELVHRFRFRQKRRVAPAKAPCIAITRHFSRTISYLGGKKSSAAINGVAGDERESFCPPLEHFKMVRVVYHSKYASGDKNDCVEACGELRVRVRRTSYFSASLAQQLDDMRCGPLCILTSRRKCSATVDFVSGKQ